MLSAAAALRMVSMGRPSQRSVAGCVAKLRAFWDTSFCSLVPYSGGVGWSVEIAESSPNLAPRREHAPYVDDVEFVAAAGPDRTARSDRRDERRYRSPLIVLF